MSSIENYPLGRTGRVATRARRVIATIVAGTLALALSGPAAASAEPVDVSGSWDVSFVDKLAFPAWVAVDIFGIEPEGPMTHAICSGSAIWTLSQDGATVSGTALQQSDGCTTRGGQSYADPTSVAPFAVVGEVHGRAVTLLYDGFLLDCPHHVVITEVEGAVATALSGGGRCIVPGHPQSEIPADPPPGGVSIGLELEAVRP